MAIQKRSLRLIMRGDLIIIAVVGIVYTATAWCVAHRDYSETKFYHAPDGIPIKIADCLTYHVQGFQYAWYCKWIFGLEEVALEDALLPFFTPFLYFGESITHSSSYACDPSFFAVINGDVNTNCRRPSEKEKALLEHIFKIGREKMRSITI